MNVFEYLNLRTEWEAIVKDYKFVGKDGTIDNLEKFRTHGYRGNRFRSGYDRAVEITNEILRNI